MSRARSFISISAVVGTFLALLSSPSVAVDEHDGVTVTPVSVAVARAYARMQSTAARLGLPPNGPDVLYAPSPRVPQMQNRDYRFKAAFSPVSGAERYVAGEYSYTDFIYDDSATTYPDDFDRYAGNAGDLAEFRLSLRDPDVMAVRFTLTSLVAEDSTIVSLALDSDENGSTGSATLPRDPGQPFPGTDQVLTTWGSGAEWSRWTGSSWQSTPLQVRTDLEANQITVFVPRAVANPSGQWRATLATGLFDAGTGGWIPGVTSVSDTATSVVNLGFRFNEVSKGTPTSPDASRQAAAPWTRQNEALAAAEPSRFSRQIDFSLLRQGGTRDNVPTRGMMYRIFGSRSETVMVADDGTPANGNPREVGEGKDVNSFHGRYLSPLQPYALYVPTGYQPDRPAPLTFSFHGDGGEYFWLADPKAAGLLLGNHSAQLFGEERDSIVLSPAGRGISGFYVGDHEIDVFEAWNDVARHFTLDPVRTSVTGYSMGGHAVYRLGLLFPHLFARAAAMVPAMCRGMWLIVQCSTTEDTVVNRWVENARNLPIFHLADVLSELTFYPGQFQTVLGPAANGLQSLDSLGYRYRFWSVATEHATVGTNHPQIRDFLARNTIEPRPFHVTFARMPSSDLATKNLVHDRAYWLSNIEIGDNSDPLAKGVIDAVSLGFGLADPASKQTLGAGLITDGIPYVETQRTWTEPALVPRDNRIVINATNIRSITIDTRAARVDCDVQLDVTSDGPLDIRLLGCP